MAFRAHLGPLKAASARGLLANYRVTRQRPRAGTRISLGRGRRPANDGRSGRFQLTPLTIWGAQPPPVAPCTPSPGYSVIASGPEAVITSHEFRDNYGLPYVGWYGCLRAIGKQRLLTSAGNYGGYYTSLGQVVLAGRFAAFSFSYEDKYFNCSSSVDIYDLGTARPGQVFTAGCPSSPGGTPAAIDSLSLSSNGFGAWRETQTYPPATVNGMSCPSLSLCVAIDGVGNVVSTTAPMGGREAWSIANVDVESSLAAVSCPSTSLCIAVDGAGNVITTTDPTGGPAAWTVAHVDGQSHLTAVSCPSTSLCVAADGAGTVGVPGGGNVITSTDPTGGPAAWSVTHVSTSSGQRPAISCPSTSMCIEGGNLGKLLTSTNPTGGASAWTATAIPSTGDLQGLSCPSTSLCVAGDNISDLLTSTNPTGGAAAWTSTKVTTGEAVISVSCPSISLCVAGASGGNVLTSTNPAGGSSAWSGALIDLPPSCAATPCLVEQLYAFDNQGTQVLDSAPPGAGHSLTNVNLSGNLITWSNNGTPHQATLR